jgi:hypothetical protein
MFEREFDFGLYQSITITALHEARTELHCKKTRSKYVWGKQLGGKKNDANRWKVEMEIKNEKRNTGTNKDKNKERN